MSLPRPTISAPELRARITDPSLRIVDVRWYLGDPEAGRRAYAAGHLPGAVFVDLDRDLAAAEGPGRHPLPEPTAFAARLGELGIGDEHAIVAYDDMGGTVAARLWWMLDRLGHPEVAVLEGGIGAWERAGGELSRDVPDHPPTTLTLAAAWRGIVDREWIVERGTAGLDLIDLRAAERYRGDVEPVDRVAGHVPGARSRPAGLLLTEEGHLLEPDMLAARLAEGAPRTDGPMVMSCGSGVTACFGALAARAAGLPDPLIYPGSYSDWSSAGLPIATRDDPGELPPG